MAPPIDSLADRRWYLRRIFAFAARRVASRALTMLSPREAIGLYCTDLRTALFDLNYGDRARFLPLLDPENWLAPGRLSPEITSMTIGGYCMLRSDIEELIDASNGGLLTATQSLSELDGLLADMIHINKSAAAVAADLTTLAQEIDHVRPEADAPHA